MKRRLLFMLTLLCAPLLQAQYSGGDGSIGSPYLISSQADIIALAASVNAANDNMGKYFQQTANIDFAAADLTPIGFFPSYPFAGTYDGNGKTVSNFTIYMADQNGVGLFGYIGGTVKNLGIIDASVNAPTRDGVAALVGWMSTGTVQNCYVQNCDVVGNLYVSGVVGMISVSGSVSGCYASGGSISGVTNIGGIVGAMAAGLVSNCYASAPVTTSGGTMGGLLGWLNGGDITNCYSTATVGAGTSIGGLVGNRSGGTIITACSWNIDICPTNNYVGSGYTTAQMKTQSTFTDEGWDFGGIWEMVGANYPRLRATPEASLPVELSSFTWSLSNGGVVLNWGTATEVNNYGFDIERKNAVWEKIGFVAGHGTTNAAQNYTFSDPSTSGTMRYRLKQIDRDGKCEYSKEIETAADGAVGDFTVSQNYPNPFNPSTTISFALPQSGMVSVKVYDVLGREVATLLNEVKMEGRYNVSFDAGRLPSGMYVYRIQAGKFSVVKNMQLVK